MTLSVSSPRSFLISVLSLIILASSGRLEAQPQEREKTERHTKVRANDEDNPFPRRIPAPSLDGGLGWLNTSGPIELSKLKGKIVLLDFWTFCCINCMHILPDLAKLEKEFPNELVVIGVHSAKFTGEQDSENIRDAIMRYEIKHPVVNDGKMKIWQRYQINSWPSLMLIDPEGNIVGGVSGEGNYKILHEAIEKLVKYHTRKKTLDKTPLHFELEQYAAKPTPLRYPGKVIADSAGNRLFIADSGHHRIIVADLATGKLQKVIGKGVEGFEDGSFEKAQFFEPEGMAVDGDTLFVADRRNHSIRKVDLKEETVTTVAGTGKQGWEREKGGAAKSMSLASPWDLLLKGDNLYIAMAGTHQIWVMDVKKGKVKPYAGSGQENIFDASFPEAAFAQPSGLASDGKYLYVADSETSSIRKLSYADDTVETIVGRGLFEFGDIDGSGDKARLQHALGVAVKDGLLYVADTYNNKIKVIDPNTTQTKTFLGDGKEGSSDEPAQFDEPGGVSIVGNTMYVADTNNHLIRVVDLGTKKVTTLEIEGLTPPEESTDENETLPNADAKKVEPVVLSSPKGVVIKAAVSVGKKEKLNPAAPMSYRLTKITADGKKEVISKGKTPEVTPKATLKLDEINLDGAKELEFALTYFPCQTGSEGICRIATQVWTIPVSFGSGGTGEIDLKQ
ncbi:redoxin domain-containing protein [bacterium]|nr:redoxin domain-containing protein [bacterium]